MGGVRTGEPCQLQLLTVQQPEYRSRSSVVQHTVFYSVYTIYVYIFINQEKIPVATKWKEKKKEKI